MSSSAISEARLGSGAVGAPLASAQGEPAGLPARPLRIVHCLRAPVGGLFRHVRDLAAGQAAAGHLVGIVCDSRAKDALTELRLAALAAKARLGIVRVAMSREIGVRDVMAAGMVRDAARALRADVLHGHGAKGGAFARIAARRLKADGLAVASFYTPHGGSLHFPPRSLKGRLYHGLERSLLPATDGLVFESTYAARQFEALIGLAGVPTRIVPNGLLPDEFEPPELVADPADVLFVGELRLLKGVDVLIEALAMVAARSPVRAVIVGDGPDAARFREIASARGLSSAVSFPGAMPARDAFRLGRCLVVPSRAESFPYIVLVAAAAGLPLLATSVGGIPEMVEATDVPLLPPGDAAALADAISAMLADPAGAAARAGRLREAVARRFSAAAMTAGVLAFYGERRLAAGHA